MKKLFLLLAAVALVAAVLSTRGTDFPIAQTLNTIAATNTASLSGTNYSTTVTNAIEIEFARFHTFQSLVVSTSNVTIGLDRSLNGVNWVSVGTNSFTDPGGTGEQTMEGKWKYARLRLYGTNATVTVNYLGGR